MPRSQQDTSLTRGTPQEIRVFSERHRHYMMSKEDLEQRIYRKNGFDDADKMFASGFGIGKWNYSKRMSEGKSKVFFDGPDFTPCNPRDVLANPSYSYVNKWFQHREYMTIQELKDTNDAARTGPKYKNLDILED